MTQNRSHAVVETGDLFDWQNPYYGQAPHVRGSETSAAAAESVQAELPKRQARVLRFLRERGELGATDEEIISHFSSEWSANTIRPRRIELVASGFVVDSGGKRPTMSGRMAVIWIARLR